MNLTGQFERQIDWTKVVYMCSSLIQLALGSRDLIQDEKRITVF